jgi:hypothetical protein
VAGASGGVLSWGLLVTFFLAPAELLPPGAYATLLAIAVGGCVTAMQSGRRDLGALRGLALGLVPGLLAGVTGSFAGNWIATMLVPGWSFPWVRAAAWGVLGSTLALLLTIPFTRRRGLVAAPVLGLVAGGSASLILLLPLDPLLALALAGAGFGGGIGFASALAQVLGAWGVVEERHSRALRLGAMREWEVRSGGAIPVGPPGHAAAMLRVEDGRCILGPMAGIGGIVCSGAEITQETSLWDGDVFHSAGRSYRLRRQGRVAL